MIKYIIFIIVAVVAFFAYFRFLEKRSLYFPLKDIEAEPSAINLTYEDVDFKTSDGVSLNGWFIPCEGAKDNILFFHGNGGNISHRLDKISILNDLGMNIFIFDYRGYGKSGGSPTENGLYLDAEAAYNYLIDKRGVSPDSIILYGESLGGAVCMDLALNNKAKAIIAECTFTSVSDVAKMVYPFLPAFLFQSKYDALSKSKSIDIPKLIMHSPEDEIIPFSLGEKLFEAAKEPKEFLVLKGSHNTAFLDSQADYRLGIKSFLKKYSR